MLVKFGDYALGHCPLRRVERLARKRCGLFDKRDLSGFELGYRSSCAVIPAGYLLRFHPVSHHEVNTHPFAALRQALGEPFDGREAKQPLPSLRRLGWKILSNSTIISVELHISHR